MNGTRSADIQPGLCSVTLRALAVDAVAQLAGECGLDGIEWGGDVHVPPGDLVAARRARAATAAADAVVTSYGSYSFATAAPSAEERATVLDTAVVLGAPAVRVWARFDAKPGTAAAAGLADDLREFCEEASTRELDVALEYHAATATETVTGTHALLEAVGAPNLFTYWQPPYWRHPTAPEADAAEITALADRLAHLHVYEWHGPDARRPLAEGVDRWRAALAAAKDATGWPRDRFALMEFVPDDDPDALRRDAAVLRGWLVAGTS